MEGGALERLERTGASDMPAKTLTEIAEKMRDIDFAILSTGASTRRASSSSR